MKIIGLFQFKKNYNFLINIKLKMLIYTYIDTNHAHIYEYIRIHMQQR